MANEPKKEEKVAWQNVKWSPWKMLLWVIGFLLLLNFFNGCAEKNKRSTQSAVPAHYHSKPHSHKRVVKEVCAPAPVVIVVPPQAPPQPVPAPVIEVQQIVTYLPPPPPQRIYVPQAPPTVVIAQPIYPVPVLGVSSARYYGGGYYGGGRGGHNFGGHRGGHRRD